MTPDQKHKELENKLSSLAQKYFIYQKMKEEALPKDAARYINTMAQTREKIKVVLFDMFLLDLEEKLKTREEEPCQEPSTVNSQPQVVSDGGTVQDL